jgi:hypothetical protein
MKKEAQLACNLTAGLAVLNCVLHDVSPFGMEARWMELSSRRNG